MAIEPAREQYVDLPYTQFPVSEDSHARMSDVGADTADLVSLFNSYYEARNWDACTHLLADHPELENCMFDAEKFNWIRDAVISMQRFFLGTVQQYLDNVKLYIKQMENTAVGIDDTDIGESSPFTTYSAYKIDRMYKVNYRVTDDFVRRWMPKLLKDEFSIGKDNGHLYMTDYVENLDMPKLPNFLLDDKETGKVYRLCARNGALHIEETEEKTDENAASYTVPYFEVNPDDMRLYMSAATSDNRSPVMTDSVTGGKYIVGISNGQLHLKPFRAGNGTGGSSLQINVYDMHIYLVDESLDSGDSVLEDLETGKRYMLKLENGELLLKDADDI